MSSITNVEVVIIGAGLSGLVAGYNILNHDPTLKIVILEAKDRIGGRILSVPIKVSDNHVNIDAGGHWISSEQYLMLNLIEDLKLTLVPQCTVPFGLIDVENNIYTFSEHPIGGDLFTRFELNNFFTKMDYLSENYTFKKLRKSKILNFYYDSVTMESYINDQLYTYKSCKIMDTIIRSSCGIEPSKISLLNYLVFCNGTRGFTNHYMMSNAGSRELWIEEGAQNICYGLAQNFDEETLLMNSPVLNILQSQKDILITTPTKLYRCKYAIIAIPPKEILKINFTPSLSSEKYKILYQNENKHLKKFALSYKERFWAKFGCSGLIYNANDGPIIFCYDATIKQYPILMGYIDKSRCKDNELNCKTIVIMQLAKYWGNKAKYPIDYIEKDWCDENYIGSCPTSRPHLNNIHYSTQIVAPFGRIYWAGTEVADIWNGFMEGAVQSGYKASFEVLYHLRPQTLTLYDVIKKGYTPTHIKRIVGNWYLSLYNPYIPSVIACSLFLSIYFLYRRYR